jgi:alkaline phosphatase D
LKKIVFSLFLLAIVAAPGFSQPRVISGPMLGQIELRDARVWVEVSPEVKSVSLQYYKKGEAAKSKTILYKGELGNDFNPIIFSIGGLDVNTTYQYKVWVNGKLTDKGGEFTTKDLWQYRKDPPAFSFLTGSCAYFNEPVYDRPGKPYGRDTSIFETMAKEKSAYMLWLGDAWYTREVDYFSKWGLWNRASRDRSIPVLQNFLKAMPHFAIWDDHDFGPNDIGASYILKDESRKVFSSYFCNPSYGQNGQGIYSIVNWGDVDVFLTDDRWWRSEDKIKDTVNGKPNPDKRMLGKQQMEWLKNSLLYSWATFKIIAMGSQALNPVSPFDKWQDFPAEYDELMNFISEYNINGVVFLTGDRHHSEIIKVNRPGTYPLYDITVSPLTSEGHNFSEKEKNNPYRIIGIEQSQNYGRISFSGKRGDRKMKVEYLGLKGEKLGDWSVHEKDLKTPK